MIKIKSRNSVYNALSSWSQKDPIEIEDCLHSRLKDLIRTSYYHTERVIYVYIRGRTSLGSYKVAIDLNTETSSKKSLKELLEVIERARDRAYYSGKRAELRILDGTSAAPDLDLIGLKGTKSDISKLDQFLYWIYSGCPEPFVPQK